MTRFRPIIFSAPMVRAILRGEKTQTRRILKRPKWAAKITEAEQDEYGVWGIPTCNGCWKELPIPQIGDRLWVRETWRPVPGYGHWDLLLEYPADKVTIHLKDGDVDVGDWRFPKAAAVGNVTPLHMPRWASRIGLRVSDVRIQRLQDITAQDAAAEGVTPGGWMDYLGEEQRSWHWDWSRLGERLPTGHELTAKDLGCTFPETAFELLWTHIHGPESWGTNPLVVATSFEVVNRNQIGWDG